MLNDNLFPCVRFAIMTAAQHGSAGGDDVLPAL